MWAGEGQSTMPSTPRPGFRWKAEADEGTDAISRQNTLALGLDYTAGPQFSAQLKAEFPVMESTQGSGTLGLSVACQPLDTLRLGAKIRLRRLRVPRACSCSPLQAEWEKMLRSKRSTRVNRHHPALIAYPSGCISGGKGMRHRYSAKRP